VKAIEYHENLGGIKRIEFLTPVDYPPEPPARPTQIEPEYPTLGKKTF
jgi:hypothetical protein